MRNTLRIAVLALGTLSALALTPTKAQARGGGHKGLRAVADVATPKSHQSPGGRDMTHDDTESNHALIRHYFHNMYGFH